MKQWIDSEKFKRFFFYGIENRTELKEGILCFAMSEVYRKYSLKDCYDIPNQKLEDEIVQEALKKYRQFAIFVTLNDEKNSEISDINIEELRKELEEEMQVLKSEEKVTESLAGIYFSREREGFLKGGSNYIYGEGLKGEEGWTKQIYDILGKLETIEEEDSQTYYQYWMLTKFARAVNRSDIEEALRVKRIYESLDREEEIEI